MLFGKTMKFHLLLMIDRVIVYT